MTSQPDTLPITSAAFEEGGAIPPRHSCDGDDVSPPLSWAEGPPGTAAFAVVVTDPDAGGFVHWGLANIPADTTELQEGAGGAGIGVESQNSFGRSGWSGPCPPSGTHRYEFSVYALAEELDLSAEPSPDELLRAMDGKVIATGRLVGTYRRDG